MKTSHQPCLEIPVYLAIALNASWLCMISILLSILYMETTMSLTNSMNTLNRLLMPRTNSPYCRKMNMCIWLYLNKLSMVKLIWTISRYNICVLLTLKQAPFYRISCTLRVLFFCINYIPSMNYMYIRRF